MPYLLFDYVAESGENEIAAWTRRLQTPNRAKLNAKLDMLQKVGPACRPQVLTGTPHAGIQKIRVHGPVQLRPLLCEGPVNVKVEFTLLAGAKEIGSKLKPDGVLDAAVTRKQAVIANPAARRIAHVRVS